MFTESLVRVCADPVVDLFVAETDGPAERTLLVVHGGPDWDHSYLRQPLDRLAGRHRLLLPDLRGCGRSTRGLPDPCYSWDAVVDDLLALLDTRQVTRADVLGFSAGGRIAQRLALTAPQRVRRLVVASSSVLPVPANAFDGDQERSRRREIGARLASEPHALTGPALIRAWAVRSAPVDLWRQELLADYLRRLDGVRFSDDWARQWQAGTLPQVLPDDAADQLARTGIPVLLLHGRHDMTFPASLAEQAATRITSAHLVVLDQAGHMAHVDQPERWLTALTAYLTTPDRPTPHHDPTKSR